MNVCRRFLRLLVGLALTAGAIDSAAAMPGQLPLGYRIAAGTYPWTGQLHALAFRTANLSSQAVLTQWEAGAQLDRQDIHARRLYLGGSRLTPLYWTALDTETQAVLDGIEPDGQGAARLAWLRGDLRDRTLRRRDTRLGSAAGSRVHVAAPPSWQPMQPGHAEFRQRHDRRPTMVWLGTRDGLLHGFDAVTGRERAAFLPRAMLPEAAAFTAPNGAMPAAPCPRPSSIDADISGVWRTLLLCAIPAARTTTPARPGTVFVLDVTTPDADTPIGLLWEASGNPALPLSGSGPVGAVMWKQDGIRRWAAGALVASDRDAGQRAGLALLPLDRPPQRWSGTHAVRRMALPASGCGAPTDAAELLAVTVQSAASGVARAAYATDRQGRLWRFALDDLASPAPGPAATCLHRQRGVAGQAVEAPVVVQTGQGALIVYGTSSELTAVADGANPAASGTPARILALPSGDGVVLRSERSDAASRGDGWTLTLPHAGERIETLSSATPVHLGFTTLDEHGQARSYLVDAGTGESVVVAGTDGLPAHAVTGLPWSGGNGVPIGVVSPVATGPATAPGTSVRDTFSLDQWNVRGDVAEPLQQARWHRRRGRLGWRELIRTSP
ncbi:Pilus assembly protein PilY [Cupriavidus sp. H18C2]